MPRPEPLATVTPVGTLPVQVNLQLYQGDDFYLTITVGVEAQPIDLTNYTVASEIRTAPGGTLIATFDCVVLDSTTVQLHLPSDESAKLTANAAWDVQITDQVGVVTTLAWGAVIPTKEVTL